MKEIDAGHIYSLQVLDSDSSTANGNLVFVKRKGEKYPGNTSHFAGTNCQEVLRAVLARLTYLDGQIQDDRNKIASGHIVRAIFLLEQRTAERHGRKPPTPFESVFSETCIECGHVGCNESCRT
jgi:hypothetical protein